MEALAFISGLKMDSDNFCLISFNRSLYLMGLIQTSGSDFEGNFRGNQLLDCLICLSLLDPNLTTYLHIRRTVDLHQSFLWPHPIWPWFNIFSSHNVYT